MVWLSSGQATVPTNQWLFRVTWQETSLVLGCGWGSSPQAVWVSKRHLVNQRLSSVEVPEYQKSWGSLSCLIVTSWNRGCISGGDTQGSSLSTELFENFYYEQSETYIKEYRNPRIPPSHSKLILSPILHTSLMLERSEMNVDHPIVLKYFVTCF